MCSSRSNLAEAQAKILSEALPYMQRYDRQTVVIKYGGNAMGNEALAENFAHDIVLLKQSGVNPVIVHGGGPQIGAMLERVNIKSEFRAGLRVTDQETVDVVEMVMAGSINKQIVANINSHGGQAVGISGKDGNLMIARKLEKSVDLGFVGEPDIIDPHIINVMMKNDLTPVVAPIAIDAQGQTMNVNADTFAGALAAKMRAKRLLLLTDVDGVLDKDGKLIEELTLKEAQKMIKDGVISGGMIPKIESCISVVQNGVEAVVILNGRKLHAVLLELYTEHGAGTLLEMSRCHEPDQ